MSNENCKFVVIEYLKVFDNGGVIFDGGLIFDLFVDDVQVFFFKWGIVWGKDEIGKLFGDVGSILIFIVYYYYEFIWVFLGFDFVVVEGISYGDYCDGFFCVGVFELGVGCWCDVFEICDWKICWVFIYLDFDYVFQDMVCYFWFVVI